jgi:hypothetical protein
MVEKSSVSGHHHHPETANANRETEADFTATPAKTVKRFPSVKA